MSDKNLVTEVLPAPKPIDSRRTPRERALKHARIRRRRSSSFEIFITADDGATEAVVEVDLSCDGEAPQTLEYRLTFSGGEVIVPSCSALL